MSCNARQVCSILIQMLLILTMQASMTHNQITNNTAFYSANMSPAIDFATSASSLRTTVKPHVWEKEQLILALYRNTTSQVTHISSKIGQINQQILSQSLDIIATNMMRFDRYVESVDSKTKDCKYNTENQVDRVKDLLNSKLKSKISYCMSRVSSKLTNYEKAIQDELNKYNSVILLQVKNLLIYCNKMNDGVMHLCLNKSWQICGYVSDKFLSSVNTYFSHCLLVYNQSHSTLADCLQKDLQVNKKYFHWAIKLFRTASCRHVLNT
ncbi:uncharacterized protein LOC103514953 isoform X1 [Diaphorina citri]|uniref:Uncharacterized protein LOC103514953 isoform X1 n=2 Tax=Diaphorina citri TaxID=121845 RepID=A0A3Q0J589_DIACI|nr:uncharacterized protein LOC103514953 isoform X1 [Diaphorina citri]KAI5724862.1 hypothetical protein M8J77_008084 [Diaphorina citri]KAI5725207.1 hypothetical protein M8J77_012475 [Diaphorina citri]